MDQHFIQQIIVTWGPLGIISYGMYKYIISKDREHRKREEGFTECFKKQNDRIIKVIENNAEVITKNTDAIKELRRISSGYIKNEKYK